DRPAVAGDGFEELDDAYLAFALEHAVDRALAVFHYGGGGEGGAVAADADESARQSAFRSLGQIDDPRHFSEVVAGKRNEVRLPLGEHAVVVGVTFDLQIEEPDGVLGAAGRLRHELETQRLEPKEDIGVEQWARVNE